MKPGICCCCICIGCNGGASCIATMLDVGTGLHGVGGGIAALAVMLGGSIGCIGNELGNLLGVNLHA